MKASREEIKAAFGSMIKSLSCPNCGLNFTDFSVEWGEAWLEGRKEALLSAGKNERDGPYKVKCELCSHKSYIDYFGGKVVSS